MAWSVPSCATVLAAPTPHTAELIPSQFRVEGELDLQRSAASNRHKKFEPSHRLGGGVAASSSQSKHL